MLGVSAYDSRSSEISNRRGQRRTFLYGIKNVAADPSRCSKVNRTASFPSYRTSTAIMNARSDSRCKRSADVNSSMRSVGNGRSTPVCTTNASAMSEVRVNTNTSGKKDPRLFNKNRAPPPPAAKSWWTSDWACIDIASFHLAIAARYRMCRQMCNKQSESLKSIDIVAVDSCFDVAISRLCRG